MLAVEWVTAALSTLIFAAVPRLVTQSVNCLLLGVFLTLGTLRGVIGIRCRSPNAGGSTEAGWASVAGFFCGVVSFEDLSSKVIIPFAFLGICAVSTANFQVSRWRALLPVACFLISGAFVLAPLFTAVMHSAHLEDYLRNDLFESYY